MLYDITSVTTIQTGDFPDSVEFRYDASVGNYDRVDSTTEIMSECYQGHPVWNSFILADQAWVTGQDIGLLGLDLKNAIVANGDIAGTTFTIDTTNSVTPNNGSLPAAVVLNADGTFDGVVQSLQGGKYAMVFDAMNQFGISKIHQDIDIQVSLEVGAPTLTNPIPPMTYTQGETITTVLLNQYVVNDGNPNQSEQVLWTLDSGTMPNALSVLPLEMSGTVDIAETPNPYPVVLRGTNESGFSSTTDLTITIDAVNPAAEIPLVVGWYSGNANCEVGIVAPTWLSPVSFFVDIGQTVNIDMNAFIASQGSSPVTSYASIGDALPTGLVFDFDGLQGTVGGLGFIEGTVGGLATVQNLDYTASNTEATSDPSGIFVMTVSDITVIVPLITGISATAGTNTIQVNFSEAIYITIANINAAGSESAAYETGFDFTVNTITRNPSYISGAGTNKLVFELDGAPFSAGNTVIMNYSEV